MAAIIFCSILLIILNIFITRSLADLLTGTCFDTPIVYRICLIPPLGILAECLSVTFIIVAVLIMTVIDIWR